MAKPRKRHVQVELQFSKRGGKRKRAGRPAKGARPSERHEIRAILKPTDAVHVTLRAVPEVGYLRRRDVYKAVRRALLVTLPKTSVRVVHLSIQGTHVHLLAEADDKIALARGMQGFQISAAKQLNAALERTGCVFPDRYHAKIIRSRRQARHALSYVLNNWRRHHVDRAAPNWLIDPYSSAASFDGWNETELWPIAPADESLPVSAPHTWLLREGWKMYGAISVTEVPGHL